MNTVPTNRPGIREQHLLRKRDNPLFGEPHNQVSNEDLMTARLEDGVERDNFLTGIQSLIQQCIDLEPNTPSEDILQLKERLDQSYQQACALPGDQEQIKQALKRLVDVIMKAMQVGAGNDAFAQQQLQEEMIARQAHFELQELPLVAALTHADSPVGAQDLIPTLLSEPDDSLVPALIIFDDSQLAAISHQAEEFLQQRDPDKAWIDAWRKLALIQTAWRSRQPPSAIN
ncbi:MAG: hypothetical protein RQ736_15005 [Thiogranum sp.]|nr:hypothetical protein [Thiogranum sp.]